MHSAFYLRTGLFVPGFFVQRPESAATVRIQQQNIDSPDAWPDQLDAAIIEEIAEPVDVSKAPVVRARWLLGPADNALILTMSHLSFDAWASGLLLHELERQYQARLRGDTLDLPSVEVQQTDIARWEQSALRNGAFDAAVNYWHGRWNDMSNDVFSHKDVPFHSSAYRQKRAGGMSVLTYTFNATESDVIRQAVRGMRTTSYSFFRSTMAIVLHFMIGKENVVFWGNFANRRRRGWDRVIGWCANTHLLGTRVSRRASVADVLRDVTGMVQDAVAHESLPLPALWNALGKNLSRHHDLRINFDTRVAVREHSSGPSLEHRHLQRALPQMDLDIQVNVAATNLSIQATFNTGRYSADGVKGFVESIARTSMQIATNPAMSVSSCERYVQL